MRARYGGVAAVAVVEPGVGPALHASAVAATVPYGRVGRWVREQVLDRFRAASVPLRIRHVHGPRAVIHGVDELAAVTIVRDGEFYLANFLAHHRRLGIRHFVMLDNGSTDGTLELLCAQPDVTVLRTSAPYKHYENVLKRYLVRRFSSGRWNVFVDIDELFDYPGSDRLDIAGLLGYLRPSRVHRHGDPDARHVPLRAARRHAP